MVLLIFNHSDAMNYYDSEIYYNSVLDSNRCNLFVAPSGIGLTTIAKKYVIKQCASTPNLFCLYISMRLNNFMDRLIINYVNSEYSDAILSVSSRYVLFKNGSKIILQSSISHENIRGYSYDLICVDGILNFCRSVTLICSYYRLISESMRSSTHLLFIISIIYIKNETLIDYAKNLFIALFSGNIDVKCANDISNLKKHIRKIKINQIFEGDDML